MNELIMLLLIFVSFIFHEFGHWAYAKDKGWKTGFKINALSLEVTRPMTATFKEDLFMALQGVLFGLPFLLFSPILLILYYGLCTFDIAKIMSEFEAGIEHGFDKNTIFLAKKIIKDYEDELNGKTEECRKEIKKKI